MKLTNTTLRTLYLEDLLLPDDTHGSRPKVRNINQWEAITSRYKSEAITIDVHDNTRDIWVWSDIHFGHKNIMRYSNRPYPTVDLMNECLIGNYMNVVKPEDIVIFGGDIGFLSENNINVILDRLPGYKIGIIGNHDMHRDGKVYKLNFDEHHLCMAVDVPDHDFDYQLLFTHYPITNVPPMCVNVHGHIHQYTMGGPHVNMCVEHTNYAPRHLKDILKETRSYMEKHDYVG